MIVATSGHVDHGKTSLVKAITGVDCDRLAEEKRRGLTIDLGFAYRTFPDGTELGFVDVPGHERFVKTMIAGIANIDFALLVVAADDGPMPQTMEHLELLDLLNVPDGAVALTKIDRVDAARAAAATAEVRAALRSTTLAEAPVFPVSSLAGGDIGALTDFLVDRARRTPLRAAQGRFRMAVDRSFVIKGVGVVATGTVFAGAVSVGQPVRLAGSGKIVRVRGIHRQNKPAQVGRAGDRCAVNLAGDLHKDDVRRGEWLVQDYASRLTDRLAVRLRVLARETKPVRQWTACHVHHGAARIAGHIAVIEGHDIAPGRTGYAELVLDRPVSAVARERFVLRDQAGAHTIGGGYVVDPFAPRERRRRDEKLVWLRAMDQSDAEQAAKAMLATLPSGFDLDAFQDAWNLTADEAERLWQSLRPTVAAAGGMRFGFAPEHWAALRDAIGMTLRQYHDDHPDLLGPHEAQLATRLPARVVRPAVHAAVEELRRSGGVNRHGTIVHLSGHRPQPTADDRRLWETVQPLIVAQRAPPHMRELVRLTGRKLSELERFFGRAESFGWVFRLNRSRAFLPATLLELGQVAERLASAEGGFSARDFCDGSGLGRNLSIELLEFFDKAGLTRRDGNRRVLTGRAAALFDQADHDRLRRDNGASYVASGDGSHPGGAPGLQTR